LRDRPFTYIQLQKFFPEVDLLSRLTDLCFKKELNKVYNGHIYYRLRNKVKLKPKSKVKVEIPKGYTLIDYQREKLDLNTPCVLKFIDGKFRNPKLLD